MSIRRITVAFLDPDGMVRAQATGSVDRRIELIRAARSQLETFRSAARREGDPRAQAEFTMTIQDAEPHEVWPRPGQERSVD